MYRIICEHSRLLQAFQLRTSSSVAENFKRQKLKNSGTIEKGLEQHEMILTFHIQIKIKQNVLISALKDVKVHKNPEWQVESYLEGSSGKQPL